MRDIREISKDLEAWNKKADKVEPNDAIFASVEEGIKLFKEGLGIIIGNHPEFKRKKG